MYDLVCIGSTIVDCIITGFDPEPVSKTGFRAESTGIAPGGEALNAAAAAADLGLKVAVCSAVGNDDAGKVLVDTMRECGVSEEYLLEREGATPITVIFAGEAGSRRSITNQAHYVDFHPERHLELFANTRAVTLGSLFRAPFLDVTAVEAVCRAAHEAGVLLCADTKLPNYKKLTLEDYANCLPLVDYLTPNEDEARYMTGLSEPAEMAEALLKAGARNVIIKLGEKGCYFRNAEEEYRIPAEDVEAIDGTGAGDNFLAGFVAAKLRGDSNYDALVFATHCGAECVTRIGAVKRVRRG